jgi:raffinose/stachyose/melibiose transport system permease protein
MMVKQDNLLGKLHKSILLFPAVILLSIFMIYPLVSTLVFSFTDWDGYSRTYNFIGVRNYALLLRDKYALIAFKNTWYLTLVSGVISNMIALIMALILDSDMKGKGIFRTLIFIPTVVCVVVSGYIWSFILEPNNGILNAVLEKFRLPSLNYLGDPKLVMPSIIAVHIWMYTGFRMVIYIAGLQTIPHELKESGYIEGAGRWAIFRHITWPLLAPAFTINMMVIALWGLQEFALVYVMTGGGPANLSQTIVTYVYQIGFKGTKFGLGTAYLFVMLVMIFFTSFLIMKYLKRREVEL